jgi:3-hydroxymyristoyl/3-hydroxydecanoyl-(acyl carrier protein) dehydratase/acyl-CoA synthetase (AMP-forming)/AMP-acid ligase II
MMSMIIPLDQLPIAGYPPDHSICWHPHKTWAELQGTAAGIASQLSGPADKPWLLALDSAFHFAAALLACWQKGITPIIAPDTQPGTIQQLQSVIGGIVTDRRLTHLDMLTVSPMATDSLPVWVARAPQDRALELFTSGSTGMRKRIPKTFAQLADELAMLHQQWGLKLQGAPRFATVSHLHIYGLLFRLLWPLCSGNVFLDRSGVYWEEILGHLSSGVASIISSPAHLIHLPQVAAQSSHDWRDIVIFSSGGPLSRETALQIAEVCGQAPIEILGSTETGGIAFRQQTHDLDCPWYPLPGVTIRAQNDLLEVRSPFLPDPTAWLPTGDRAELVGAQQFHLRGRADRIVKLSEKRLSLTAMESRLAQHEAAAEARVVLLPPQSHRERSHLAAVVVLTRQGRRLLEEVGTASLIGMLRDHLLHDIEPAALPRLWRFPEVLPYNTQGKVAAEDLLGLFQERPPAPPTDPLILAREDTNAGYVLHCKVPENLPYLQGHFPQVPVVPGVCQLQWVIQSIETYSGRALHLTAMEAVKFHHLLVPGQTFCLEVRLDRQASKWMYRLFSAEQTFASGRLVVAP